MRGRGVGADGHAGGNFVNRTLHGQADQWRSGSRLMKPASPIPGVAAAVHHRHDQHKAVFNRVQNSVGEYAREAAANVFIENTPTCRRFQNPSDRVLDSFNKPFCQIYFVVCVIGRGREILVERIWMELIPHQRMMPRALLRPSSPWIVPTRPLRTSSRRRLASSSHTVSIRPSSRASRLSTRISASCARDSAGRSIARSASSSRRLFIC